VHASSGPAPACGRHRPSAEADARQQAAEAGYGNCTVVDRTVKFNTEFREWDATVTVDCLLLD
jgi:hypothetical protein